MFTIKSDPLMGNMAGHSPLLPTPQTCCCMWCRAKAIVMVALMTKPSFVSCL